MGLQENTRFVFDPIARRYDLCNKLFSCWLDHYWRRKLVYALTPRENDKILDICSGTGDMVFCALKHSPARNVFGIDVSGPMLNLANKKEERCRHKKWIKNSQITWLKGDAANTPFDASTFDVITCAFGIRNITDRASALAEMSRILKSGGRIGFLEFSLPPNSIIRWLYLFYLTGLMPFLGRALLKSKCPLFYLSQSIRQWHENVNFELELKQAGFDKQESLPLTAGIVTLWTAQKIHKPL